MSLSIVILAAGQGTRMKSSTPKVLHTISGKPMLFHAIDAAKELSDDITIVLHHQAEKIEREILEHYRNIRFHLQDAERFPGTGGAMKGIDFKHDRILILNGDMPLITTASLEALVAGDADINMSVIKMVDPSGYGRVIIDENNVREIVEEKDCTNEQKRVQTVNAGIYAVKSELLERYIPALNNDNAQKEYYLTDIIQMAEKEGRTIHPVYVREEEFKGVNSKLDLSEAEVIMQRRIKEKLMMAGVIMHLPDTIYIDCRAVFEGESILENGVTIHGSSRIIESHIKSHSVLEDALIIHSSVGPMARIRPQSKLADTQIGNFVEVKKSTLNGVKAGHLSYLGDATIGEGSNIGAGVITCNYDGKAKYTTTIGRNVFVGSDSQLIAPVTIEDNVIIAAGTTVTKDVPQGHLTISRTPQKFVSGFFRKFFGDKGKS